MLFISKLVPVGRFSKLFRESIKPSPITFAHIHDVCHQQDNQRTNRKSLYRQSKLPYRASHCGRNGHRGVHDDGLQCFV